MPHTNELDRASLVAASTIYTVSLPAGFIEQPGGPIDIGFQEFVAGDGTVSVIVNGVFVLDLVIRQ